VQQTHERRVPDVAGKSLALFLWREIVERTFRTKRGQCPRGLAHELVEHTRPSNRGERLVEPRSGLERSGLEPLWREGRQVEGGGLALEQVRDQRSGVGAELQP